MKRKNNKAVFWLILAFIALNTILFYITEINKNQRIKTALDNHIEKIKTHYEILLYHQTITAKAAYESTINSDFILKIMEKALDSDKKDRDLLREELRKKLLDKYNSLRTKGVVQYHFVFKDNTAFLRMHKPSKFGDDLTNFRADFAMVNKTQKPVQGFEQGRTAHAFRHIYPLITKEGRHIGAVEISFTSDTLQNYLNAISKIHTHFLVNKHIFDTKAWSRDDMVVHYTQSAEDENYMITVTKEHIDKELCVISNKDKIEKVKGTIKKRIAQGEKFAVFTEYNDRLQVIAFYPIKNIKEKKTVAWVVSYEYDKFLEDTIKGNALIRVFSFILLIILFYFIYRVVNQKQILDKEVKEKTRSLKNTNIELTKNKDELKELNANLEQRIKKEVQKSKLIQEKLFKSEKLASMGEMIGNIAHQWRQPLSVISTGVTGLKVKKEYDRLEDEEFFQICDQINNNAQYLSRTIDDFKNFIKGERKKEYFNLKENINSFLHLVEATVLKEGITVLIDIDRSIKVNGLPNELIQCFINIFNNSKDAFKETLPDSKYFFIKAYKLDSSIFIEFKDNAGGMNEDIKEKIFEPYFTTKHKSQGTGLGMHMTYTLITQGMRGNIEASNESFRFKGLQYKGAKFLITLPEELGND
jgi:signal transduction histidine kinase